MDGIKNSKSWVKSDESVVVGPLVLMQSQLRQPHNRKLAEQFRAAEALERCMGGWRGIPASKTAESPCSN